MRPVILSRPEKTAVGLTIFCAGGSTIARCSAAGRPAAAALADAAAARRARPAAAPRRRCADAAGRRRQRLGLDRAGRRSGRQAAAAGRRNVRGCDGGRRRRRNVGGRTRRRIAENAVEDIGELRHTPARRRAVPQSSASREMWIEPSAGFGQPQAGVACAKELARLTRGMRRGKGGRCTQSIASRISATRFQAL